MNEKFYNSLRDYFLFDRKGGSEKISLDYELESDPPWVYFFCPSGEDLSFAIHDLEFGPKFGNEESIFWHLNALDGNKANFEGFTSYLSFLGQKRIRGYLGTEDFKRRTGIVANRGRVEIVRPFDERMESWIELFIPLRYYFEVNRLRSLEK
jgi:hypothetical protein